MIFFIETITVHLFSSFWLANFHGYAVFTLGASAIGTGLLGGMAGTIAHFFPAQLNKISELEEISGRHPFFMAARILWFCTSWILWEWIKSTGLLAYPWGTLSMAAYRWKIFTQIADITGVWGISFIFALFSAVLAEGLWLLKKVRISQNPDPLALSFKSCTKFTFVIFAVCGAYGIIQYIMPRIPIKHLNAIIVQQNADPWEAGDEESIQISTELTEKAITQMNEEGIVPDLVLWSEGTLARPYPYSNSFYADFPWDESLTEFIDRMDVPFIIGGIANVDRLKRRYTNISVLYDREGQYAGFYSKMHLVPFAELIPLEDNPLMSWFMQTVVKMPSSMSQGKQSVIFKIPLNSEIAVNGTDAPLDYNFPPSAKIELDISGLADREKAVRYLENPEHNPNAFLSFSTPICFEDAFPDVCRKLFADGSEVFLNITNDSWSNTAYAEYQHFIAASYRAIEFRTTLVRSCNSGYSAVVEPNGRIRESLDVFTQDALSASIPIYQRKNTIYFILGDWLVYAGIAVMILYFAFTALKFYAGKRIPKFRITITKTQPNTDSETTENKIQQKIEFQEPAKVKPEPVKEKIGTAKKTKTVHKTASEKETAPKRKTVKRTTSAAAPTKSVAKKRIDLDEKLKQKPETKTSKAKPKTIIITANTSGSKRGKKNES